MSIQDPSEHDIPRVVVRTRWSLGGDGDETVDSTVFCPVQERSLPVVACEGCSRFHAMHFEPSMRLTSVLCRSETATPEGKPAGGRSPPDPETPLADIMTKEVICVRADVDLQKVKEIMMARGFGGIPVVDAEGKPVGMVSRTDLLRIEHDRGETAEMVTAQPKEREELGVGPGFQLYEPGKTTAGDVMTAIVLALHESSNIGQASSLMAYEEVHRLPVVADDGRVVGILSALDVLRWYGRRSGYLIPEGMHRKHE